MPADSGLISPLMNRRHKAVSALVEESARRRLANKDEINAVLRHVKTVSGLSEGVHAHTYTCMQACPHVYMHILIRSSTKRVI